MVYCWWIDYIEEVKEKYRYFLFEEEKYFVLMYLIYFLL